MRPTSSEFSRDVQPIWRPTEAGIKDVPAPLQADGSKFLKHFPSLSGQPSQAEAGDLATKGPVEELCGFAAGALIACTSGPRAVEDLAIGDLVETMDHGPQAVQWIGMKTQAAFGDLAPVRFQTGAFGAQQTLDVGPHQRMHLVMPAMELLFGFPDGLAPAKYLVGHPMVAQADGAEAQYFQLLFENHEIIWANGVATESLLTDEVHSTAPLSDGLMGLSHLFPDLADSPAQQGPAARPILEGFEARLAMSYSKSPSDMVLSG